MDINDLSNKRLEPFDNLDLIKRYFATIGDMDKAAVAEEKYDLDAIMALWHEDGQLTIRGKDTVGEHNFEGSKDIAGFYEKRTRGFGGNFRINLSSIDVANSKNRDHITASGVRYMVTRDEAGLQAPFTHNFKVKDGKIAALDIHVGTPGETELAPVGALRVEDMGRLSAMAWMVA